MRLYRKRCTLSSIVVSMNTCICYCSARLSSTHLTAICQEHATFISHYVIRGRACGNGTNPMSSRRTLLLLHFDRRYHKILHWRCPDTLHHRYLLLAQASFSRCVGSMGMSWRDMSASLLEGRPPAPAPAPPESSATACDTDNMPLAHTRPYSTSIYDAHEM